MTDHNPPPQEEICEVAEERAVAKEGLMNESLQLLCFEISLIRSFLGQT
jgi:hypothetical protein